MQIFEVFVLFGTSSSSFHDFYPQPELTVENLPSFLLLGKALLLLFVGEEEDKIGRRQNQALVKEMRTLVESEGETMERYLACWIHLYVSVSAYLLLYFSIVYTIQNPHFFIYTFFLNIFCFSGRTPAGMSVLGSYVGSMPPLPALVLTHLPSGDQIYQYPPNTPIVASAVLHWLQRVEDGTESPTGKEERRESLKLSLQSHKFQDSYAIQL